MRGDHRYRRGAARAARGVFQTLENDRRWGSLNGLTEIAKVLLEVVSVRRMGNTRTSSGFQSP
jgi:hypothetical protein